MSATSALRAGRASRQIHVWHESRPVHAVARVWERSPHGVTG
jgi:hypothetical protein